MIRVGSLLLLCAAFSFLSSSSKASDDDSPLKNSLLMQQALASARHYLLEANDPKKAVDLLEEQIGRANGNPTFLRLLRDAYRAYIKELWLTQKSAQVQRYMDRLLILDPSAAQDATLRPEANAPKVAAAPAAEPKPPMPNFSMHNPAARQGPPAVKPTVRAQAAEVEDPFDLSNRRGASGPAGSEGNTATPWVAKGDFEFAQQRFPQALQCYEQARRLQPSSLAPCHERYAYCLMHQVADSIKQPGFGGRSAADLTQQVQGAMALAPKSLTETGTYLLREIGVRSKGSASGSSASALAFPVQHLGKNREGWNVADSANFRIFHHQDEAAIEKIVQIAEQTRRDMAQKWLGSELEPWAEKCEMVVHSKGEGYAKLTGAPLTSPGHTRVESDPGGRVVGRRLDLRMDVPEALEAVLPHETTHLVLAGQFGSFQVPRWTDEGVAVLTEPSQKISQHRHNLQRCADEGSLFTVKELMTMQDYPPARRISAFYAQSVTVVDYLVSLKGPQVFISFVREGVRQGYENALQRHYGLTFEQVQEGWQQHAATGTTRVAGK